VRLDPGAEVTVTTCAALGARIATAVISAGAPLLGWTALAMTGG
jgi:hypothetical protein